MAGSGTEPAKRRMDSLNDNSVVVPQRITSDTVFSLLDMFMGGNCVETCSMKEDAI